MKLYLTLEDGNLKVEKVMKAEYSMFCDHDKYGEVIEEMSDMLHTQIQERDEELANEAKRLTQHND